MACQPKGKRIIVSSQQYREKTLSKRSQIVPRLRPVVLGPGRILVLLWALRSLACGPSSIEPLRLSPSQRQVQANALLASSGQLDGPGVAVLMAIEGEVVYRQSVGFADLDRGTLITSKTNFRLGSISKQITAMAIMLLAEEGKLDLDDPMIRHLPELANFGPDITLRNLLIHTAGLPEVYDGLTTQAADERPRNSDLIAALKAVGKPRFQAGQRFEYCNVCYDLLALVTERVSSQDFGTFLDERIFTPLGMHGTSSYQCPDPDIDRRALGYRPRRRNFVEFDADRLNCILGAGGIYSNLEDLHLWLRSLDQATLLPAQRLAEAFTSGTLDSGESVDYGFGWTLDSYRGLKRQSHTGSWVGFRNYISRYPEVGLTLIMLANHSDFDRELLAERLADLYLDRAAAAVKDS